MKIISKALVFVSLSLLGNQYLSAQTISTIAGNGIAGFAGDGGTATAAEFHKPNKFYIDGSGNIYVPDNFNNRLRKISSSGIVTTIAGTGVSGGAGDGGPAALAQLYGPTDVTLDVAGNIYIAELDGNRVRKINTSGIISTIAGNGMPGFSGDGGPAVSALLHGPESVYFDAGGNLYISDAFNQRIRKINSSGIISTFAGNGWSGYSGDGSPATAAGLSYPYGLSGDASGNIYLADQLNHVIRKINASGIISTVAGNGFGSYGGDGGPATDAQLNNPTDVYADNAGNLLIGDKLNQRVRKVSSSGIITTIAGVGTTGFSGDGGPATNAQFNWPAFVTMDAGGRIYISDNLNYRIRVISGGNTAPHFVNGPIQNITICLNESTIHVPIDSELSATDPDIAQVETWSVLTPPLYGSLAATYSTSSTGGILLPSGLTYTPTGLYVGLDTFKVGISDGFATDETTIIVNLSQLPDAGIISGIDSICEGESMVLIESVPGGTWSNKSTSISGIDVSGNVTGVLAGLDTILYIVTNTCGSDTSFFPISVKPGGSCHTSVASISNEDVGNLSVFPNPNNGQFFIEINSVKDENANVTISNILGEQISNAIVRTNHRSELQMELPEGIYLVSVYLPDCVKRTFIQIAR